MNSRGRPAPLPLPRSGRAADHIFSVSEITRGIRSALEDAFGPITVQGEVAGYKGTFSSGHTYFSLKDAGAQIDVVLYADRATPAMLASLQNGLAFQVYGELTVYEKSGRYQIRALRVEPMGYGALQARFDALRKKLELEGLFATERKRRLPLYFSNELDHAALLACAMAMARELRWSRREMMTEVEEVEAELATVQQPWVRAGSVLDPHLIANES